MRTVVLLAMALVAAPLLAFVPTSAAAQTLVVGSGPGEFHTIQAAVDAAQPGDTILVEAGDYQEEVVVTTSNLTVRGVDRDSVVLDGGGVMGNGFLVTADWVSLESMTAQNYAGNGFMFSEMTGFRMYDLRSIDNAVYGLYAIHSEIGDVSYSEASGSGDAGFYIGETPHCDCDVHHNVAYGNLLAYSGTANSYVRIHHNEFYNNRAGIVPNVLPQETGFDTEAMELYGTQVHTEIYENHIHDNNNMDAPESGTWETLHIPAGVGIMLAGGWMNDVHDNVIENNTLWGVSVFWLTTHARGNHVHDNVITGSRVGIWWDEGGEDNCFENNDISDYERVSDPDPLPGCTGPLGDLPCPDETYDLAACRASNVGVWNPAKYAQWIAYRAIMNIPPEQDW